VFWGRGFSGGGFIIEEHLGPILISYLDTKLLLVMAISDAYTWCFSNAGVPVSEETKIQETRQTHTWKKVACRRNKNTRTRLAGNGKQHIGSKQL